MFVLMDLYPLCFIFRDDNLKRYSLQISDESNTILPGVLVSLSGSSFRQNRITSENESLIFPNLVSYTMSKLLSCLASFVAFPV